MVRPVSGGSISQGFGPTDEQLDGPYNGYAHFNKGLDFAVAEGTGVAAVVAGTVVSAGDSGDGWGLSVKIRDANGYTHNYGHLSAINVKPGQKVGAGTAVGAVGSTGKSTGPHLSYDVWGSDGKFVDPTPFIGGDAGGGSQESNQMPYDKGTEDKLRQAAEAAWAGVLDGSVDPKDWLSMLEALDYYRQHGSFDATEDKKAQDAFDNSIKLGDFQGREADRAYARWQDKRDAAKAIAGAQIDDANAKNKMNFELSGKRFQNGPEPDTKTYFAPTMEDAFNRWKGQLGVGDEPSANGADYGGPSVPVSAPRGAVGGGSAAVGGTSPATGDADMGVGGTAAGWKPEFRPNWDVMNESDRGPLSSTFGGSDGRFFGIGGPGDLKPAVPGSIGEWLFGKDKKFFGMGAGNGQDYPFQKFGGSVGSIAKRGAKKLKGLAGLAQGGENIPGGLYQVGEQGMEHAVLPDGQVHPLGQQGPEVASLPQGSSVLPADVPPEQAYIYAKIKQLLAQEGGGDPGKQLADQQGRANDPQLQEKVIAALMKGVNTEDATNPPKTPVLTGGGWKQDPWADWRPLTGIPANGQQAPAQGGAR